MKVLFYNSTPLAGMPYRTAKVCHPLLEREGGWFRSLTLKDRYGDRTFPMDLIPGTPEAEECIATADIIIGGAYMTPPGPALRAGIPFVRHYSTEHQRWRDKAPAAGTATVVAQYQARFGPNLDLLPNCIPIDDPMYSPGEKPTDRVVVMYTPTSKAKTTPGQWAAKGYEETMAALRYLTNTRGDDVEVFVMENRPHEEVMKVRRKAHIVIDECATGSYHSTALEGLSCGAVSVCWLDSKTEQAFERVLKPGALQFGLPFSVCPLVKIRQHLDMLTGNPDLLRFQGGTSRDWMEEWYSQDWQASMWIDWHRGYLKKLAKRAGKR